MQFVSQSDFVKCTTQCQFGAGVFLPDTCHDLRARLTIDGVHSNSHDHASGLQSFQVFLQSARRGSASYQDSRLHVSLHGMTRQVRTRNEAEVLVSHRYLRVDLASYEVFSFVDPRKKFHAWHYGFHSRDRINGDSAAVRLPSFE